MISNQSRSKDWIMQLRERPHTPADPILIEKMILALILLENLHDSGLDFTFKGGTSLLLMLGKPKRFSIDIDIIIDTKKGLEGKLQSILQQGVFYRLEEDERSSTIPKHHYKFFYTSEISDRESSIMLDILVEKNPYLVFQNVLLVSEFLILEGEPKSIKCPVPECLLGDKLTAFAPNTSGVLYGNEKDLEIIKQLFDIGLLFDEISDINLVAETFHTIATKELFYRGLNSLLPIDVLVDSFETACLIGMRGFGHEIEFSELKSGIRKLTGYIYAERFTLDSAILCAAKAAYLTSLIRKRESQISRFHPSYDMSSLLILDHKYNKLNKIKKTSPEAFYYFYQALMS